MYLRFFFFLILAAWVSITFLGCAPATSPLASTNGVESQTTVLAIQASGATLSPTPQATSAVTSTMIPPSQTPSRPSLTPSFGQSWRTYANPQWGISLDYPAGWSVNEQGEGVAFTPPGGQPILLARQETAGLTEEEFIAQNQLPNSRCLAATNPHGFSMWNCNDTLSFTRITYLFGSSLPPGQIISLTLLDRANQPVYEAMLASFRSQ